MSKYIRTERGVYEVVDFDNECIIPSPIIKMNGNLTHCCDYKNYRQADTIEELCDEFVLELDHNDYGKPTSHTFYNKQFEYFKQHVKNYKNSKGYGAIWTNKGLIYVAKMNEDGELILL